MEQEDYLILLARFCPEYVKQEFIPEIERNCKQFGIYDQAAYEAFQKDRSAVNSLYFHHSYAVADIPAGREYHAIAYSRNGEIQAHSIQKCSSKILCFFTAFRTQPSAQAMRGHHELSLIQFESGLPPMLNELVEVTERKPIDISEGKEIYLGSEKELRRLVRKKEAASEAAELLKSYGMIDEKDYRLSGEKKISDIISDIDQKMRQLVIQKYELEESDVKEIFDRSWYELWRQSHL